MENEEALEFLRNHQPMPPDDELSEELITSYDLVREFFMAHRDERCVPLFLNSFGNGSGFGVYQLVDNVITQYDSEIVLPHLQSALNSNQYGVRYWSTDIAALFPDPILIPSLSLLLHDPYIDIRLAAATALEQIKDPSVKDILHKTLMDESDELMRDALREIIDLL